MARKNGERPPGPEQTDPNITSATVESETTEDLETGDLEMEPVDDTGAGEYTSPQIDQTLVAPAPEAEQTAVRRPETGPNIEEELAKVLELSEEGAAVTPPLLEIDPAQRRALSQSGKEGEPGTDPNIKAKSLDEEETIIPVTTKDKAQRPKSLSETLPPDKLVLVDEGDEDDDRVRIIRGELAAELDKQNIDAGDTTFDRQDPSATLVVRKRQTPHRAETTEVVPPKPKPKKPWWQFWKK